MSSSAAPRCQHIKVNGTQCGSPALRKKSFCFYHQQHRPLTVECYSEGEYATGEIALPVFEDAHSIQSVIRQVVQMVLQKRIERKTASLLLYALQIASSNLKRMELEKPQPSRLSPIWKRNRKLPWQPVTTTRPAAKFRQARNPQTMTLQTMIGKLAPSTPQPKPGERASAAAKTFRPEPSRPVISLLSGIVVLAKTTSESNNM